jgi:hypothetical protein
MGFRSDSLQRRHRTITEPMRHCDSESLTGQRCTMPKRSDPATGEEGLRRSARLACKASNTKPEPDISTPSPSKGKRNAIRGLLQGSSTSRVSKSAGNGKARRKLSEEQINKAVESSPPANEDEDEEDDNISESATRNMPRKRHASPYVGIL